jgi:hypothetical protein
MLARSTVPPLAGLMMSIVPLSAPMRSRRPFSPLVSDRGLGPADPVVAYLDGARGALRFVFRY